MWLTFSKYKRDDAACSKTLILILLMMSIHKDLRILLQDPNTDSFYLDVHMRLTFSKYKRDIATTT